MKRSHKIIALLAAVLIAGGAAMYFSRTPAADTEPVDYAGEVIAQMSLRDKVGQLFIIRPESVCSGSKGVVSVGPTVTAGFEAYPAGGFAIFQRNITSPGQLKAFTAQMHGLGKYLPLVCIDEEGGKVTRIDSHPAFDVPTYPDMQSIASTGDTSEALKLGRDIGAYLNEYGVDVDFAPVADLNTNPKNKVIGARAFGNNPELAGEMVSSVIQGLHEMGIASCIKHYPGHGDTVTDTHSGYADTDKSWDELLDTELKSFVSGMDSGSDMVMAAHVSVPAVTGNNEPASMSYALLTEKLRGELAYDGIIITDACEMGAISKHYSSAEAAVSAIKAGADIVLMPANYKEAFDAVAAAVESGKISEERINESVRRVLLLKDKYHEGFLKDLYESSRE